MVKGKKLLGIILSITLCASLLAACGGKADDSASSNGTGTQAEANINKDGFPIVNESVTLSMMGPDVGIAKWADMPFFKTMEEKTGIKLEFKNAPNDSYETKRNLVLASGDVPDIFFGYQFKSADEVNYGGQGVLIPLEDLIDQYAPNIKKILDENPDVRKSITTPDGHIYTLPKVDLNAVWYMGPMWYNGKFLKALGYDKVPQNIDELYTYLKRVKTEDPNGNGQADEIPLTSVKLNDGIRMWLMGSFGLGYEDIYADKDGKVHYAYTESAYKDYLTFMNKLWNEELLDHETFSQTDEQKGSKGKNNQVGLFQSYYAYFMTNGTEPSTEDPMYQPVSSSIEGTPVVAKHPGLAKGAFAITNANKHPEATIRWIDYLYSTEGAELLSYGPEGMMWDYVNKDTHEKKWNEVPDGKDREEYRGSLTPDYGIVVPGIANNEVKNGFISDFDKWIDEENKEKLLPFARVPFPSVYLSEGDQQTVSATRSDLNTYVEQMEAKFITGQEPLANFEKYLETAKKMGAEKMVEIYQTAYDQWKQN
ncbi:extracellular solute-binding protein [Paenibacillus sp. 1001270B_150601_E10]|uniref:extracellular solute-binding protein n=1 Tax=Paenibacillus sp. 1001270B_150601_E10 TaxID=2787079 RepID=UPI00189D54E8|nr:extracellular solute-binding protein [Paenibacillus sp. 1001270B_150601_E10]